MLPTAICAIPEAYYALSVTYTHTPCLFIVVLSTGSIDQRHDSEPVQNE